MQSLLSVSKEVTDAEKGSFTAHPPLLCVSFQGLWEGGEGGKGPRDGGIDCWKMGCLLGGKWGCLVLAWEGEWRGGS